MKPFGELYGGKKQWTFALLPTVLINRDNGVLTIAFVWMVIGFGIQFNEKDKEQ